MVASHQYYTENDIKDELGIEDSIDEGLIYRNIRSGTIKEIHVKDFGAKGDGIKNDSSAIKKAITVLRRSPMGSTLVFEKDKTYYISSGKYALDLRDLDKVNVNGNNCTILVKPIMSFCRIDNCVDLEIKGLNFDYKTKPYAVAELINVFEDGLIRVKTDSSLNIRGTYNQPFSDYFGFVDRPDSRYHIGISEYKVVNRDQNLYDVKCNNNFADRDRRIDMLKNDKYKFVVPMPHVGQVIEHAVLMEHNKNILLRECSIRCAAKYMFYIKENKGFVYFNKVNVKANPNDEDLPIVGWRDGFYCKDNRAKLVWDNCKINNLFDDIVHISSTVLHVQQVQDKCISLKWKNHERIFNSARVGDEIIFYNEDTGEFLGSSIILGVNNFEDHIDIRIKDEIEDLVPEYACKAVIWPLTSPGAVIKYCDFHGTFRFNSSLFVKSSNLHVTRMWTDIKVMRENVFGKNILFSDCKIDFDEEKDKYIHVDSNNINWENAINPYCMSDVVFFNCKIKNDVIQMGKIETENSVVRFIKSYY